MLEIMNSLSEFWAFKNESPPFISPVSNSRLEIATTLLWVGMYFIFMELDMSWHV